MNFFQRHHANKQIKTNIAEADNILRLMQKCIVPANNIYWCNNMFLMEGDDDEINFQQLKSQTPAFISYAKQLRNLFLATEKLTVEYPEMVINVVNEFSRRLQVLDDQLSTLIADIKELKIYDKVPLLQQTVKVLKLYLKTIIENNKIISDYKYADCDFEHTN